MHRPFFIRFVSLLIALLCMCALAACNTGGGDTESSASGTPEGTSGEAQSSTASSTGAESAATVKKRVALTFDDGPQHYESRTKAIVDELSKYGFHATFFVVGNRVPGGDALSYAVEKGCEIGIHGFTHEFYYDKCTDAQYRNEIEKTAQAIEKAVPGYNVRLMRPVGGRISNERLAASPYSVIFWSVDSLDWEHRYASGDSDAVAEEKVNTIVDNVMNGLRDGDVILMHDIYESTYDATLVLLERLHAEGYEVVTVSELFGETLLPGKQYTRGN